MKFRTAILMTALVAVVFGCATIVKSGMQTIPVNSTPAGAEVKVYDANENLVMTTTTPATLKLKKGKEFFKAAEYKVVISLPGYKDAVVQITGTMDTGWYLVGNFVLGGILGWLIIDPISGAMWNLSPEQVNAAFGNAGLHYDGSINVVLASDVPQLALALATPVGTLCSN